jgi:hypothetical protein
MAGAGSCRPVPGSGVDAVEPRRYPQAKQQRSRVPTTEWTDVPTVLLQSMVIIVLVGLR